MYVLDKTSYSSFYKYLNIREYGEVVRTRSDDNNFEGVQYQLHYKIL